MQAPGHGTVVLLDPEAVRWWIERREQGAHAEVYCGSLKAWAALEAGGAESGVRWLGPLGPQDWELSLSLRQDWHQGLADIPVLTPGEPASADLAELLTGDLATPALLSLSLLPAWTRQLAPSSRICLPVGRHFRPPRFSRLGDLPLMALASALRHHGHQVELLGELEPESPGHSPAPPGAGAGWRLEPPTAAAWLAIGKLRHPEVCLVALEAAGLAVALFESDSAPPLPDLFEDSPRFLCHARLDHLHTESGEPPLAPAGGARASAREWLDVLRTWPPLKAEARAIAAERQRLDAMLARHFCRSAPRIVLVPEENSLPVERLLLQARAFRCPIAILHHTAEVLPLQAPLRWQRHISRGDPLVVPLRGQRPPSAQSDLQGSRDPSQGSERPSPSEQASVLMLDAVRAHLLDALELEAPLPFPSPPAVGWLHYPLHQQALVPLADPASYWEAVETVRRGLKDRGVTLYLARKPPLEPAGLGDAFAQGLFQPIACLPLPSLLARSQVLIAPGHLGTGHFEAIARGRVVVLVTPDRLDRPSRLLEGTEVPLPRIGAAAFPDWFRQQGEEDLARLARTQVEWLRHQVVTSEPLVGWLTRRGVACQPRDQRFLGSGLMAQRPLLERVEAMDRLSRRLRALRRTAPGRLLDRLRRVGRR